MGMILAGCQHLVPHGNGPRLLDQGGEVEVHPTGTPLHQQRLHGRLSNIQRGGWWNFPTTNCQEMVHHPQLGCLTEMAPEVKVDQLVTGVQLVGTVLAGHDEVDVG